MTMRALLIAAALLAGATQARSAEIPLTSAFRTDVEHAIREEGYACPRAKLAHAMGPGPRGEDVLVRCGQDDGSDGLDARLVYKVSIRRDGGATVTVWHGDPYRTH
jgi:hypothetical protein